MADQRQPVVQTVPTAPVFSGAVIDAWTVATGDETPPPKEAVAVLYAHYMIETGGLNCYGWNIGNVKYTPGCGYDYFCLRGVWEGEPKRVADVLIARGEAVLDPNKGHQRACSPNVSVVYQPPHPMTRFIAYPNLSEAMRSHLVLLCRHRYVNAWPFVLSGDVPKFTQALKDRGYFTSSAAAYAKGMAPAFSHFMASRDYETAMESRERDVTSPVIEFSGGIVHPMPDPEPIIYDSDDSLAYSGPMLRSWWRRFLP